MIRAARTDTNAKDIDKALERIGATVAKTDGVASGFPDRVVGFNGKNILLEYKDGSRPPSRRRLNPLQKEWHKRWAGQVAVVNSPEEAIAVVLGVINVAPKETGGID
jgi:hypothetical protein|tara:strand:+ start:3505 stop:3825 length:321 start_codon:yes stop_codon:yes gene_type:complete